jgi:DNA-binding transcriptional MocR family regulator
VLQYGPTRGYRPLREATLEMMRTRGITSDIDRVVITTGSQQGSIWSHACSWILTMLC